MDDAELESILKAVSAKDLKEEAKKQGIPLGRCPTKLDIARKLPEQSLRRLARR